MPKVLKIGKIPFLDTYKNIKNKLSRMGDKKNFMVEEDNEGYPKNSPILEEVGNR